MGTDADIFCKYAHEIALEQRPSEGHEFQIPL